MAKSTHPSVFFSLQVFCHAFTLVLSHPTVYIKRDGMLLLIPPRQSQWQYHKTKIANHPVLAMNDQQIQEVESH